MSITDRTYSYCLLTYNQAATVADAVASALAQDCPALEIVISDDCSTDDTFAVIESTLAGYIGPHRIVLSRNPKNYGLAGNIARIHELSTGDVIIVAAGDDVSMSQRSAQIMAAFAAEDPLLVCSHAVVMDQNGIELPGNFHRAAFYRPWTLAKVAKSNALYIGATGAWARELYTKYGPMNPDAYEDLVFGFRAALEGRVCVLNERLVHYRLGLGITSLESSLANAAGFTAHRAKSHRVAAAVLEQRTTDALTSGLPQSSHILHVIRKAEARAVIGLAFCEGQHRKTACLALRHPLLALDVFLTETRKLRKFKRRLAKA